MSNTVSQACCPPPLAEDLLPICIIEKSSRQKELARAHHHVSLPASLHPTRCSPSLLIGPHPHLRHLLSLGFGFLSLLLTQVHCSSSSPFSPSLSLFLCCLFPSACKQTVHLLPKEPLSWPLTLSTAAPFPPPLYSTICPLSLKTSLHSLLSPLQSGVCCRDDAASELLFSPSRKLPCRFVQCFHHLFPNHLFLNPSAAFWNT